MNELIVRLDPQMPGEDPLQKRLDKIYMTKTYGELSQKLLDPNADELNKEYTESEKILVTRLESCRFPRIAIYAKSGSEKEVNPNDNIEYDLNQILSEEKIVNERGEQTKIPVIELTITFYGVEG